MKHEHNAQILEITPSAETITRLTPVKPTNVLAHAYAPPALATGPVVKDNMTIPARKSMTSVAMPIQTTVDVPDSFDVGGR